MMAPRPFGGCASTSRGARLLQDAGRDVATAATAAMCDLLGDSGRSEIVAEQSAGSGDRRDRGVAPRPRAQALGRNHESRRLGSS